MYFEAEQLRDETARNKRERLIYEQFHHGGRGWNGAIKGLPT